MSKSVISEIVERHGLKPGQPMRNVNGDDIPGSAVLSRYMVIHRDDNGYRLISENPLLGSQTDQWISKETLAALAGFALEEDGTTLAMAVLWTSSDQFVTGVGMTPDQAMGAIRTIPGVAEQKPGYISQHELQPAGAGWTASVD